MRRLLGLRRAPPARPFLEARGRARSASALRLRARDPRRAGALGPIVEADDLVARVAEPVDHARERGARPRPPGGLVEERAGTVAALVAVGVAQRRDLAGRERRPRRERLSER